MDDILDFDEVKLDLRRILITRGIAVIDSAGTDDFFVGTQICSYSCYSG